MIAGQAAQIEAQKAQMESQAARIAELERLSKGSSISSKGAGDPVTPGRVPVAAAKAFSRLPSCP